MTKRKIHFVCRGNVHRSRIAEAYAKSLGVLSETYDISSSGIDNTYPPDSLSPWAVATGHSENLDSFFSPKRVLTSSQLLQDQDLIIFMSRDVYRDARQRYSFNTNASLVWNIKDREDWPAKLAVPERRRRTFRTIKRHVDKLFHELQAAGWVDIVDEDNQPLGYSLPTVVAHMSKTVWHRGCQLILTTPDGRTVIEKRSRNIVFAPGLLDITVAGHVDAGETPAHASVREAREEIGVDLHVSDLRLLEVSKRRSYHPHYRRYTRSIIYTYHAQLPSTQPHFALQTSEVAEVRIVSNRKLRRLLAYHQLHNFGRLNYPYAYYRRIIRLAHEQS